MKCQVTKLDASSILRLLSVIVLRPLSHYRARAEVHSCTRPKIKRLRANIVLKTMYLVIMIGYGVQMNT